MFATNFEPARQIFNAMYADGTCPTITNADGTTSRGPCPDAYGMVLGAQRFQCAHDMPLIYAQGRRWWPHSSRWVSLLCLLASSSVSFLPWLPVSISRATSGARPDHSGVGTVIVMIGMSLIGASGMLNWGGGSNGCEARPDTGIFQLCPTINAPHPLLCAISLTIPI